MVARNRARYLAPIALAATIVATFVVVTGAGSNNTPAVHTRVVRQRTSASARAKRPSNGSTFYTVKAGDTLSSISVRTGVSLPTLQQLNSGVNPTALQTGQRLRLRQ